MKREILKCVVLTLGGFLGGAISGNLAIIGWATIIGGVILFILGLRKPLLYNAVIGAIESNLWYIAIVTISYLIGKALF